LRGVVATVILTAGLTVGLATASAATPSHHANAVHRNVRCPRVAHNPRQKCRTVRAARTTRPSVTITSGPASGSLSSSASASFGFSSPARRVSFRCAIDSSGYSSCSSPMGYAGLANSSHTFRVIAVSSGVSSRAASVTWTVNTSVSVVDTTPPSTPTGLAAAAGDKQVALSWNGSTDNVGVAGYHVYRNGGQVAQTTATTFTDSGLTDGTSYSYTAVAFDAAGNNSTASSAVSATPVAPQSGNQPPPIQAWVPANGSSFTPLSDSAAAANVIPTSEVHAVNNVPNHTVPTSAQLQSFHSAIDAWGRPITAVNPYFKYVTGNFTGTTDEIIQWGAWKWGIPEDWLRAEYSQESMWKQAALGDRKTVTASDYALYPSQARIPNTLDVYQSMGLTQVKWTPNGSVGAGAEPMRWTSTAFNVDYQLASIRYLFDNPQGLAAANQTSNYFSGNGWDSLGGWFSYYPWVNSGQLNYINAVQGRLSVRTWAQPGF
jgi:chitodextrinase